MLITIDLPFMQAHSNRSTGSCEFKCIIHEVIDDFLEFVMIDPCPD